MPFGQLFDLFGWTACVIGVRGFARNRGLAYATAHTYIKRGRDHDVGK